MLNRNELKQLLSLLKKIDNPHAGLPQSVFDILIKIVPFVACELAIVDDKKRILLTWREDRWWRGWHFPGGLLRYRETFEERIRAVARKELGVDITNHKFLFAKDCSQGARSHVVSLVFRCETMMVPKQGRYFKKMPKNIIEEHKKLWAKIQKSKS